MLTILFFGVLSGGVLAGLALFGSAGEGPGYDFPDSHRWHDIQWAAHTGILLVGSLVALQFKPATRPVLVQFLIGATIILAIVALLFGHPEYLIFPAAAIILALLYQNRAGLLDFVGERGLTNLLPLGLAIAIGLVLLPEALDKLDLQRANVSGDEHAEFLHWALGLVLLLQYLLAGLLIASGRPGSRALSYIVGASMIFLGIGALVLQSQDGIVATWSVPGALLALAGGSAFFAIAGAGDRLRVSLASINRSRSATG